LKDHPDIRVRWQVVLSLGDVSDSWIKGQLTEIADRDAADPWMRVAVLSSRSPPMPVNSLFSDDMAVRRGARELARQVAWMIAKESSNRERAFHILKFVADDSHPPPLPDDSAFAILAGLGEGLRSQKSSIEDLIRDAPWADRIRQRLGRATAAISDRERPTSQRIAAIELIATLAYKDAVISLAAALHSGETTDIQRASLQALAKFNEPELARTLVTRWKQLTPPLREEAINVLLSRPIWQEPLVAALERGEIQLAQLTIPQRTRLAAVRDPALAERAKKVLGSFALSPRKEAIDKYQPALALKADGSRGQAVYRRECANCHKLAGEGHDVGPSLETIRHRSPQEILIHVLDPNREVSPQFLDYTVRLGDGRVLTGMIAAETDAGLTLRRAQKQEDTVLRSEIDDIASSGKSLMPEGLEQKITPQELADLIGFLRPATR